MANMKQIDWNQSEARLIPLCLDVIDACLDAALTGSGTVDTGTARGIIGAAFEIGEIRAASRMDGYYSSDKAASDLWEVLYPLVVRLGIKGC